MLTALLLASQIAMLDFVKLEAKKWTRYPTTIAAICLTETSAGVHLLGDEKTSLGILQIQVPTVRFLATKDKSIARYAALSNKRLETLLLTNNAVSVEIASKLFEYHRKRHGYFGAVSRYNGGSNNMTYYKKVEKNKRMIR